MVLSHYSCKTISTAALRECCSRCSVADIGRSTEAGRCTMGIFAGQSASSFASSFESSFARTSERMGSFAGSFTGSYSNCGNLSFSFGYCLFTFVFCAL
jgi:hypothetical protein